MLRVFPATTSLAALGVILGLPNFVHAQIDVTLGGNIEFGVTTSDESDLDLWTERELKISASGTANNGLNYGVSLEVLDGTAVGDDYTAWVSGQFGEITFGRDPEFGGLLLADEIAIGEEGSAHDGYNDQSLADDRLRYAYSFGDATFGASVGENNGELDYELGGTYAGSIGNGIYTLGFNAYRDDLSTASMLLMAGAGENAVGLFPANDIPEATDIPGTDDDSFTANFEVTEGSGYGAGGTLLFGNFTVAGGFTHEESVFRLDSNVKDGVDISGPSDQPEGAQGHEFVDREVDEFSIGLGYAMGDFRYAVEWATADATIARQNNVNKRLDPEGDAFAFGVAYDVAPGVVADFSLRNWDENYAFIAGEAAGSTDIQSATATIKVAF